MVEKNTSTAKPAKRKAGAILWVEFFRTIWHSLGRFLAIAAIIALGAGFFSGLRTATPAMTKTADTYIRQQNMYDLQILSSQGFEQQDVEQLRKTTGVTAAQGLINHDVLGHVSGKSSDDVFSARSLPTDVSKLRLVSGRMPRAADECVADSQVMGPSVVGNTITWKKNPDFTTTSCKVTASATTPDFLGTQRGASDLGNGKTYAFLYMPAKAFTSKILTQIQATVDSRGTAFSDRYNKSVSAHTDDVKKAVTAIAQQRRTRLIDSARKQIADRAAQQAVAQIPSQARASMGAAAAAQASDHVNSLSSTQVADQAGIGQPTTHVLTRSSNIGYASFENDTGIVAGIALVFPVFFLFVAAMVCLTTVTKMIDEERSQIGLLKALGYKTGSIAAKYLGYSGLASILGCVVGVAVGTFVFPAAIWSGYAIMYSFAPISYMFDGFTATFITIGYLLLMLAVTWGVCWNELRSQPATLLRPEAPKPGKKILLEHVGILWNHLSFLHKISLRNVFRFKKRLFMILAGVAGCTALIVTCFGIRDSVSQIPSYQYDHVDLYSASVQLEKPESNNGGQAEATSVKGTDAKNRTDFLAKYRNDLSAHAFVYENTADADMTTKNGIATTKSVSVIAAPGSISSVVKLHNGSKALPLPSAGSILINRGMAHSTGLGVGDHVSLRTIDGDHISLRINGIFDNYIATPVYISMKDATKLWSDAAARTALVRFRSNVNEKSVYKQMERDPTVQFTTPVSDERTDLYTMMRALDAVVALIILSAGALALIVLLNLTGINITERIREIATIKVLGFYQRETAAYVFRENIILTTLGIVIGLPVGKLFHMFIMSQIKVDVMYMVPDIQWMSYVYSALLTFAFLLVTCAVMYRRIAKIDMAGALKSPE